MPKLMRGEAMSSRDRGQHPEFTARGTGPPGRVVRTESLGASQFSADTGGATLGNGEKV